MTVKDLAALQTVDYTSHELDTGDKRSCGEFTATYSTERGPLVFKTVFDSSGSPEELTVTLNGETVTGLEEVSAPDFGTPHYYSGSKAEDRFETSFPDEADDVAREWLEELKELDN